MGSVVADAALRGLLKVNRQKLEAVEDPLCKIMTAYSLKALPQAPLDMLLKARVQFCCKAGEALGGLARGSENETTGAAQEVDIKDKLAVAESKLPVLLQGCGCALPARVACIRFKLQVLTYVVLVVVDHTMRASP